MAHELRDVAPGLWTWRREHADQLHVWATPWHDERALPALRALLDLPFEHVIVSHGEPLHGREAYERAPGLPPWSG